MWEQQVKIDKSRFGTKDPKQEIFELKETIKLLLNKIKSLEDANKKTI